MKFHNGTLQRSLYGFPMEPHNRTLQRSLNGSPMEPHNGTLQRSLNGIPMKLKLEHHIGPPKQFILL